MDPRMRYCVELAKVEHLPDYQRIRAEKRFLIIKAFEDDFATAQRKRLGPLFKSYKVLQDYCNQQKLPLRTYHRWHKAYAIAGIMGLVPQYGERRGSRPPILPKRCIVSIKLDLLVDGSPTCLEELAKVLAASPLVLPEARATFLQEMKRICRLIGRKSAMSLKTPLTNVEREKLVRYRDGSHKKHSMKATAILMIDEGRTMLDVGIATNTPERTIYNWLKAFNSRRLESIETHPVSSAMAEQAEDRKNRIVGIIHSSPSLYGINRSTWTYPAIAKVYEQQYGTAISTAIVQRTLKRIGYTWRHARKVLTSPDPEYKAKVEQLLATLRTLRPEERFFFIDEVGPYRVKKYGGKRLTAPGELDTVPEAQRSRGKVQFVAALEARSNQLTWFFCDTKGSVFIITLLEQLIKKHRRCTKLYVTWDAITVHSSKMVRNWIASHNQRKKEPQLEVIPLPSRAQFLNVIEAVFCGMKRAVICCSDYRNADEMKQAIAGYFVERNEYYRENPKRAGNKIWDKQRFDLDKLMGGLFKRM